VKIKNPAKINKIYLTDLILSLICKEKNQGKKNKQEIKKHNQPAVI